MDFNADSLKNIYLNWVKQADFIDLKNSWVEIKTPFTDFTGSFISLFAKKQGDIYILTDYGNILNELEMHSIINKSRLGLLNKILSSQHCSIGENNDICIKFQNICDFPKYKHQLIQAIINVSDLFLTSKASVENLFTFDVFEYLDKIGVSYSSRPYAIEGKELSYTFDMNIGQIKNKGIPVLHSKIINRLNDNMLKTILYSVQDLTLDTNEKFATIINDTRYAPKSQNIALLQKYNIEIINWSKREAYFTKYAS